MASSKISIDWDRLRPRILQDLADGKTQQQIRDGLAKDPDETLRVSVSKSQLETQLKHWKYRNSLHKLEWKVVSHRINKRRKAGRTNSQVLVNGFIFNERKVAKAISRYDTPTLLYRMPSPEIPTELSHHFIEVRTPPLSHRSPQLPPSRGTVAQTRRETLALHLNSAGIVWPQTSQWRNVELAVSQFVARFFLPTYEQDERFRDAFNQFGREPPVSLTDRGQKNPVSRHSNQRLLPAQAWDTSTDPHDAVAVPRCEIPRSFDGLHIQTAVAQTLVGLLYGLSNQSLGETGRETLASIMDAPAWDIVLPRLRDVLAMIDSKLVQAIAEGLLKESIHTCNHSMLDLSLNLGADPTKHIRIHDYYESRDILCTPLVAICNRCGNRSARENGDAQPLLLSLLKRDPHVSNTALLRIIIANCHSIAEDVIRSQPERAIDFTIELSDLPGDIRFELERFRRVTPLLIACSDRRQSPARLSLIRCLLERNAKADLVAMLAAAHTWDGEVISLLYQHGAPVNGFISELGSPLSYACLAARDHKKSMTAVLLLLKLGASPNNADSRVLSRWIFSPLHILALTEERPEVTEALDLLLKHGADINYRAELQTAYDLPDNVQSGETLGMTALEWAINGSRLVSAIQLLSADCELTGRELFFFESTTDIFRRLQGETFQERLRHFIGALLVKAPEQATARHWSGLTALQFAIRNDDEHMILALFAFGVSPAPSDFLYMLCNKNEDRAQVCLLSNSMQMKLVLAAKLSGHPITKTSIIRLILAFACPEVARYILNDHPDVYDSEGLCYVIARLVPRRAVANFLVHHRHEEEDRQRYSLTMDILRTLVSRRTTSNMHNDWESTAVVMAARAGRADILRILIEPIQEVVRSNGLIPLFLLKEFLTHDLNTIQPPNTNSDSCNSRGLDVWARYCRMDDPNMRCSPLSAAVMVVPESTAAEIVDMLLSLNYEPDGWTVLIASCQGYLSVLQRLKELDCWAHILSHEDRPEWCPTALQIAVYNSHPGIVRFILDAGTTIDAIDLSPCQPIRFVPLGEDVISDDTCTILPRTALQHAVDKQSMEMVTLFVNAGADVNAPAALDSGATALQIASIQGSIPMMEYLISQGADPYAAGAARRGRTALQGAAEHGRKDAVELLLAQCESTAFQHREEIVDAIFYAEKNAQHVVAGILRERLLPGWSSEDEDTLEMLSEDWECSSGNSEFYETRQQYEAWEETFMDLPKALRAYESNIFPSAGSEQPLIEDPIHFPEDNSWSFHEMDFGIDGQGGLSVGQIGEIDFYDGDVVSWLNLQEENAARFEGQLSLEGDEVDDVLFDTFLDSWPTYQD